MLFYIQFFLCFSLFTTCKTKKETLVYNKYEISIDSISVSEFIRYDSASLNFDNLKFERHEPNQLKVNQTTRPNNNIKIKVIDNPRVYKKTDIEGKVIYQIPSEMKVRETSQVFVRIGKSSVNIYENLNGEIRETSIPITQTMEVSLVDPSPSDNKIFEIIPDNQAIQIVDSTDTYTQWTWNVTPLKSGSSDLKIVVSIIKNGNKKEVVYQDKVKIKINPFKQFVFWFNNYWQWLFTTLLIPVFKWLYDKYFKKEKL